MLLNFLLVSVLSFALATAVLDSNKNDHLQQELNFLLYQEPFAQLQEITHPDASEEEKEFVKGWYLELENLMEKVKLTHQQIERIKTACNWHRLLHIRMYNEDHRREENKVQDFKTYYRIVLDTDYPMLKSICKQVRGMVPDS